MKKSLKHLFDRLVERATPYFYTGVEACMKKMAESERSNHLQQCQDHGDLISGLVNITIVHHRELILGNNVHIGTGCFFHCLGGLTIGDNTHISRNVTIYCASHDYEGEAVPFDEHHRFRGVKIGKNVWIGTDVRIAPGTIIGDGAIIGMGAVVSGRVGIGEIATAARHSTLKRRNMDKYFANVTAPRFAGVNGKTLAESVVSNLPKPYNDQSVEASFCLTTGRSGSTSIALWLQNHPEIHARHEPRSNLISLSTQVASGEISLIHATEELRSIYETAKIPNSLTKFLESDQKFFNLVKPLREVFTRPKFIWLIRDGRACVSSTHARGWFAKDHEKSWAKDNVSSRWNQYRLDGVAAGVFSPDEWEEMDSFSRNCWYWSHVNSTIATSIAEVDPEDVFTLRVEDFQERKNSLLAFLGLRQIEIPVPVANVAKHEPRPYSDWSGQQREIFGKFCGKLMVAHYPEADL